MKNLLIILLLLLSFSCKKKETEEPTPSQNNITDLKGDTAFIAKFYGDPIQNITVNVYFKTGSINTYSCNSKTNYGGGGTYSNPVNVVVKLKNAPKTGNYDIEPNFGATYWASCTASPIAVSYKDSLNGKILIYDCCHLTGF
jgi:hypothetical protein